MYATTTSKTNALLGDHAYDESLLALAAGALIYRTAGRFRHEAHTHIMTHLSLSVRIM